MKNNLELILLVGNWVVVAIQAFTIFGPMSRFSTS